MADCPTCGTEVANVYATRLTKTPPAGLGLVSIAEVVMGRLVLQQISKDRFGAAFYPTGNDVGLEGRYRRRQMRTEDVYRT